MPDFKPAIYYAKGKSLAVKPLVPDLEILGNVSLYFPCAVVAAKAAAFIFYKLNGTHHIVLGYTD